MEIRFAQAKDVIGIIALLRQVGEVHRQGRPDIFRNGAQKYGASQILSMLDNSATPIFVAVENGAVLGYGRLLDGRVVHTGLAAFAAENSVVFKRRAAFSTIFHTSTLLSVTMPALLRAAL